MHSARAHMHGHGSIRKKSRIHVNTACTLKKMLCNSDKVVVFTNSEINSQLWGLYIYISKRA